jgi:hypothetical protein
MPNFSFAYAEDEPVFKLVVPEGTKDMLLDPQIAVNMSRMITQAFKFWIAEGVVTQEEMLDLFENTPVVLQCQTDERGNVIQLFPRGSHCNKNNPA